MAAIMVGPTHLSAPSATESATRPSANITPANNSIFPSLATTRTSRPGTLLDEFNGRDQVIALGTLRSCRGSSDKRVACIKRGARSSLKSTMARDLASYRVRRPANEQGLQGTYKQVPTRYSRFRASCRTPNIESCRSLCHGQPKLRCAHKQRRKYMFCWVNRSQSQNDMPWSNSQSCSD